MVIKDLIETFKTMFSPKKNVSTLQMSLTVLQVMALILSNILVVKTIDLFGIPYLATSCAILTFPITYTLSDVFSEVYGYRWSRVSGTWAVIGTVLCSLLFTLSIKIHGNAAFTSQDAFATVLGNTPKIAFASVLAFWIGDTVDDKVFDLIKSKFNSEKSFGFRAILSSLAGKYVDGFIFTFIGLSFLPLETKIIMVINCPLTQIILETLLLPTTHAISKKLKKVEGIS